MEAPGTPTTFWMIYWDSSQYFDRFVMAGSLTFWYVCYSDIHGGANSDMPCFPRKPLCNILVCHEVIVPNTSLSNKDVTKEFVLTMEKQDRSVLHSRSDCTPTSDSESQTKAWHDSRQISRVFSPQQQPLIHSSQPISLKSSQLYQCLWGAP